MNGAKSLVKTLLACGVDTCFANPGTSEMHFVAALDQVEGMKCVLGLQENVVTGMADGYYRVTGKPACTLLHCGPGLANGLANLHNARRGQAGIVNIVGDQATYHRPYDAPLTADTYGLASAVSAWVRTCTDVSRLTDSAVEAVKTANTAPGRIATLILPADVSWNEGGVVPDNTDVTPFEFELDPRAVQNAADVLKNKSNVLLLLGGMACSREAQTLAAQIAEQCKAGVKFDYTLGKVRRGSDCPPIDRVPYTVEAGEAALQEFDNIILVNAGKPVTFFAYPNKPSFKSREDADFYTLTRAEQDPVKALEALAGELGVDTSARVKLGQDLPKPEPVSGEFSPEGLMRTVAALLPENAILVEEAVSYGRGLYKESWAAAPHDILHLAGGAIGNGLPLATGAAIGAKGQRRVVNLQADGSAMYTVQSLWTQVREKLPVTTLILSNRKYNILIAEYANVGATMGSTAERMLDLGNPDIDWVTLANGMGVEAKRANNLDECADLMRASFKSNEPFLIELMI